MEAAGRAEVARRALSGIGFAPGSTAMSTLSERLEPTFAGPCELIGLHTVALRARTTPVPGRTREKAKRSVFVERLQYPVLFRPLPPPDGARSSMLRLVGSTIDQAFGRFPIPETTPMRRIDTL